MCDVIPKVRDMMGDRKPLYSTCVAVLGFVCFVVGATAVGLPVWGYFDTPYGELMMRGRKTRASLVTLLYTWTTRFVVTFGGCTHLRKPV